MDAVLSLPVLIALIVVALAFDMLNGLHDEVDRDHSVDAGAAAALRGHLGGFL